MKKKEITVNRENIKQAIAIQVTFNLENKLQKQFLSKYDHFSLTDAYILNTC